jgi:hypothetical protein
MKAMTKIATLATVSLIALTGAASANERVFLNDENQDLYQRDAGGVVNPDAVVIEGRSSFTAPSGAKIFLNDDNQDLDQRGF